MVRPHFRRLLIESCGSTNDLAFEYLSKTEAPVLVVANEQTNARGRQGREWLAPSGGLWCSFGMMGGDAVCGINALPFAAALACADAAKETSGLIVELKWPNDLMAGGRKLGGILVETRSRGNAPVLVVVGIGLNLTDPSGELDRALKDTATTLLDASGVCVTRDIILAGLERGFRALIDRRKDDILGTYRSRCGTVGKDVEVQSGDGLVRGRAMRLDDDFALVLRTERGEVRITSGDVHIPDGGRP